MNPNNKGPNDNKYYYHAINCKSRKDAHDRALRDSNGAPPIFHGNHYHASKYRGDELFKFGNSHYTWK